MSTGKIAIIVPASDRVFSFRKGLIDALKSRGYEVSVLAFDNEYAEKIRDYGIDFYCIQNNNRSLNPVKILSLAGRYSKIIKKISPDIVFTFQLKPNIFGVFGAKKAGVSKIFSMVEGAGDCFIYNTLKWKLIRFAVCSLYRISFRNSKKVFFLNNDDKIEFTLRRLVNEEQCIVIPGIGVDLNYFESTPVDTSSNSFLMVSRMLETKGVWEYIKCAQLVKKTHPEAQFNYLGEEVNVKVSDIQPYIDDCTINYLGVTDDVRPYLHNALLLLLLSSYREGMPMSIMEAEASGRGVITSNNIGCKETVIDGYNGYLIEQKDYVTMAKKCIEVLENKQLAVQLGKNARKFAEENFDQKIINQKILDVIL